jgi:diacylglycerol kinase family enzyme
LSPPPAGGARAAIAAGATCLLINPLSCRTLYGSLARRAETLARAHGLRVVMTGEPARIQALLRELHAERAPRLFVLAGDGTIQLIARFLATLPAGEWNPELLLLGGGRANVVPRAYGGTPAIPALRRVLQALGAGQPLRIELQPLLRVQQADREPQLGFVLAGAMIEAGVRYCRDRRNSGRSWWRRGILADQISLLKLAALVMLGRSPLPEYPRLRVTMEPGETLDAPVRVLMAGALHRAGGHYNPYAARGEGPLRLTAVAADAPGFWRNLPRMLRGSFDARTMGTAQGYLSGHCVTASVRGLGSYALDGEECITDPARPVELSIGMSLKVIHA